MAQNCIQSENTFGDGHAVRDGIQLVEEEEDLLQLDVGDQDVGLEEQLDNPHFHGALQQHMGVDV